MQAAADAATTKLLQFMSDMKAWEQNNRRVAEAALGKTATYPEMKAFRLDLLNQVLRKHCRPDVIAVDFRSGSPTYYDPRRERITHIEISTDGRDAVIATESVDHRNFDGYGWKYTLQKHDDDWRVVARQCRRPTEQRYRAVPLF